MKKTRRHRQFSDVEAPSYGHRLPQNTIDVFEDDTVNHQRNKRQGRGRFSSLVLGLVTLAAAGMGAYFFLDKDGIDLQKGASQHAGFQGNVSMATIEEHASPEDCWLAIHGSVYDLTQYAPIHPGPSTLITAHCGTDATAPYTAIHSQALLPTVNEYLLGTLEGEGGSPGGSANPPISDEDTPSDSSGKQIALAAMQMHSVPGDCWVAYYGNVYDITEYAPNHPASSTLITSHCGTDATGAYTMFHSKSLLSMVNQYLLGALEGADPSTSPPDSVIGSDSQDSEDGDPTSPPTFIPQPTTPGGPVPPPTSGGNPSYGSSGNHISLTTMASHSTPGDYWVAYHGQVYDMTQYAPTHPASSTLITMYCGADATAAYAAVHSRSLLAMVNQYLLGTLQGEGSYTEGPTPPPTPPPTPAGGSTPTPRPIASPTPPPTSSPSTGSPGSQISLTTMASHSTPGDCWVAYHGQVYDMTQYAPTHPASSTLITRHCGADATAAYAAVHSRGLLSMVNQYLLGTLQGGSAPSPTSAPASPGKQISLATIARHSTTNDCWVAYYDKVYDMTQYAPNHPARSTLITHHCGTNATRAYARAHGRGLLSSVNQYLLGAFAGADPLTFPIDYNDGDSFDSGDNSED